jgi:hypothetical protein
MVSQIKIVTLILYVLPCIYALSVEEVVTSTITQLSANALMLATGALCAPGEVCNPRQALKWGPLASVNDLLWGIKYIGSSFKTRVPLTDEFDVVKVATKQMTYPITSTILTAFLSLISVLTKPKEVSWITASLYLGMILMSQLIRYISSHMIKGMTDINVTKNHMLIGTVEFNWNYDISNALYSVDGGNLTIKQTIASARIIHSSQRKTPNAATIDVNIAANATAFAFMLLSFFASICAIGATAIVVATVNNWSTIAISACYIGVLCATRGWDLREDNTLIYQLYDPNDGQPPPPPLAFGHIEQTNISLVNSLAGLPIDINSYRDFNIIHYCFRNHFDALKLMPHQEEYVLGVAVGLHAKSNFRNVDNVFAQKMVDSVDVERFLVLLASSIGSPNKLYRHSARDPSKSDLLRSVDRVVISAVWMVEHLLGEYRQTSSLPIDFDTDNDELYEHDFWSVLLLLGMHGRCHGCQQWHENMTEIFTDHFCLSIAARCVSSDQLLIADWTHDLITASPARVAAKAIHSKFMANSLFYNQNDYAYCTYWLMTSWEMTPMSAAAVYVQALKYDASLVIAPSMSELKIKLSQCTLEIITKHDEWKFTTTEGITGSENSSKLAAMHLIMRLRKDKEKIYPQYRKLFKAIKPSDDTTDSE